MAGENFLTENPLAGFYKLTKNQVNLMYVFPYFSENCSN